MLRFPEGDEDILTDVIDLHVHTMPSVYNRHSMNVKIDYVSQYIFTFILCPVFTIGHFPSLTYLNKRGT